MSYEYLEKYKINEGVTGGLENSFYPINKQDISYAETKLHLHFPKGLIKFWREIGCGFLRASCTTSCIKQNDYSNRLLSPVEILEVMEEEKTADIEEMKHSFNPEEIPILDLGDYSFIVIKRDDPNGAVYFYGTLIEPNFEDFIHNLYYKSPVYYLDVLVST